MLPSRSGSQYIADIHHSPLVREKYDRAVLYYYYTDNCVSFAESIECTFNGTVGFGKRVSCTIPRNGDLLTTQWLEITMKKHDSNASYYPAEALIKELEVEIGGQRIDKIYNDWFRVYDELYRSGSEKESYRSMVDFDDPSAGGDMGVTKRFYLPLVREKYVSCFVLLLY
jgi:hypothetical protein